MISTSVPVAPTAHRPQPVRARALPARAAIGWMPSQGFFGTDGQASFEGLPQIVKIPHLRNAYTKVGMFGFPGMPFFTTPDTGNTGNQIRGFGYLHDGSIDTVFHFLSAVLFAPTPEVGFPAATYEQTRRDMEQFMLAFESDIAPIVGQQITLTKTNSAVVGPRIDLLQARAAAPLQLEDAGRRRDRMRSGGRSSRSPAHRAGSSINASTDSFVLSGSATRRARCVVPRTGADLRARDHLHLRASRLGRTHRCRALRTLPTTTTRCRHFQGRRHPTLTATFFSCRALSASIATAADRRRAATPALETPLPCACSRRAWRIHSSGAISSSAGVMWLRSLMSLLERPSDTSLSRSSSRWVSKGIGSASTGASYGSNASTSRKRLKYSAEGSFGTRDIFIAVANTVGRPNTSSNTARLKPRLSVSVSA